MTLYFKEPNIQHHKHKKEKKGALGPPNPLKKRVFVVSY